MTLHISSEGSINNNGPSFMITSATLFTVYGVFNVVSELVGGIFIQNYHFIVSAIDLTPWLALLTAIIYAFSEVAKRLPSILAEYRRIQMQSRLSGKASNVKAKKRTRNTNNRNHDSTDSSHDADPPTKNDEIKTDV